jgi:hypothetical protein
MSERFRLYQNCFRDLFLMLVGLFVLKADFLNFFHVQGKVSLEDSYKRIHKEKEVKNDRFGKAFQFCLTSNFSKRNFLQYFLEA